MPFLYYEPLKEIIFIKIGGGEKENKGIKKKHKE